MTRQTKLRNLGKNVHRDYQLYLLLLFTLVYFVIFHYGPMYGLQMAFQNFKPSRGFSGSDWVGLANFQRLFNGPYFVTILRNTLTLSVYYLVVSIPIAVVFALLLNSVPFHRFKRVVQTVTYAPHFISIVVLVGMLRLFFSPTYGIINSIIKSMGGTTVNFLASANLFPSLYVWSSVWQEMGWSSVIYLASLASVSPELHEAAMVDGAGKLRRIWHIDLPAIIPTLIIMMILACGKMLNVGFEKAYLMQNDVNASASEIISTYSYKTGLIKGQYSFAAAIGLFNSVVNCVLIVCVNMISRRVSDTSLW